MTSVQPDLEASARLVESLTPWSDQAVIIGGWAHRLHRLHASARALEYEGAGGFYAEFLTPSIGSAYGRGGKSKGTTEVGGVVSQNPALR